MRLFLFGIFFFGSQLGFAVQLVDLSQFNSLLQFDDKAFPPRSPLKKTDSMAPSCRVDKAMAEAVTKAQTTLRLSGISLEIKQCHPFALMLVPVFEPTTIQKKEKAEILFQKAMRGEGFRLSHAQWWDFIRE